MELSVFPELISNDCGHACVCAYMMLENRKN